jgi:hypothetical protein
MHLVEFRLAVLEKVLADVRYPEDTVNNHTQTIRDLKEGWIPLIDAGRSYDLVYGSRVLIGTCLRESSIGISDAYHSIMKG